VREILVANGEHTRLGFIGIKRGSATGWDSQGRLMPPLPTVPAHSVRDNTPLWSRYVTDAHGIQILTDEHLAGVADLSSWLVTPVASGRYLVEAPNLED
jgi:hypothetical protein